MADREGGMSTVEAANAYLDLVKRIGVNEPTRDERRLKARYLRILYAPASGEPATKGLLPTTTKE